MLTAPVLQLDAARMHEINPRNVESLFGMWTVFSRCATTIPDGKRLENLSWRIWGRETLCCPPQPEKTIVPAIDISPARSSGIPSLSSSVDSNASSEDTKVFTFTSSRRERSRKLSESENSALSKSRGKEPHLTSHVLEKIVTTIQEKSELCPLSPRLTAVVDAKMQAESPRLAQPEYLELPSAHDLPYSADSSCMSNTTDATARQADYEELSRTRDRPYSAESSCMSNTTAATVSTARQSDHRDSETSVSSNDADGLIRSGSVVHGFSPAPPSFILSRSRLSQCQPPSSSLRSSQSKKLQPPATKSGMFTLGASSEDDESSFDSRMSPLKQPAGDLRTSSLSKSLANKAMTQKPKQSFKAIIEQHRLQKQQEGDDDDEGAIASSDEDDDDDDDAVESAIEEEDEEGEWTDSHSEAGEESREPVFKRIDSRPNLTSHRSILTKALTEKDRASELINAAVGSQQAGRRSREASRNGPSMPASPEENDEDSGMMMQRAKGTKPLPIIATTSNTYAMAHSPRTTRRNMLSTELTQSLRQNLLWERQQKNTTVNAFLKRQAQSMANLQRLNQPQPIPNLNGTVAAPEPNAPYMPKGNRDTVTKNQSSWNHYFDNAWEYHAKGW